MELFFDFRRSPERFLEPAELEQSEQLLGCYHTFLGHELPNQLVPLQAFARLLLPLLGEVQEGRSLDPEIRGLLEQVVQLTADIDAQVRQVAELGRLFREPLLGPPIPLADVVAEAAAEVHWTGTPFDCVAAPDLPVSNLSRRLLHRVLVQLFRNAAQAGSTRATLVRVDVEGVLDPPAYPLWGAAISVRDNGRGLSEARAAQLFQPFVPQAGTKASGTSRRTLGLFLVRQILTRWGGAVAVRSQEHAPGTTFTLLLPPSSVVSTQKPADRLLPD